MSEQLRAALDAARARLQPALAFVRAHRFWVGCASVASIGVLVAFWVGYASLGRTAALEARAEELHRAEASLARWGTELRRPDARESAYWRDSDATLRSLGGDSGRALAVARLVAQRAAEVGISAPRVQLLAGDSLADVDPVSVGRWLVEPSGEGLSVDFDGGVDDVIGLLGALPPQAALVRLDLSERAGVSHARLVLVTRRIAARAGQTFAAGTPTAEELDSLGRYLAPTEPAPRLDDYAAFLPARRPARFVPPVSAPAEEAYAPAWQLSAIMIAGARPVAIINDQPFAAGARLPDGAVVLQIERDHVVIRAPNGTRRRLELAAG